MNPKRKAVKMSKIQFNVGTQAPSNSKAIGDDSLCMVCGRKLGANPFYFEVNTSWEVITPNDSNEDSQGCFPVGSECAKKFAPNLLIQNLLPEITKTIAELKKAGA